MSSSTKTKTHYGPLNSALLRFDWDEEETQVVSRKPPQQVAPALQPGPRVSATIPTLGKPFQEFLSQLDEDATVGPQVKGSTGAKGKDPLKQTRAPGYGPPAPSLFSEFDPDSNDAGSDSSADETLLEGFHKKIQARAKPETPPAKPKAASPIKKQSESSSAGTSAKPSTSYDKAVDIGFGQRYKAPNGTGQVVITNSRKPFEASTPTFDCAICAETFPHSDFPSAAVTKTCAHSPSACLKCVATSIRTDLSTKLWSEIRCPECSVKLAYDDVQRFADDESRQRYETLSFRSALAEAPNFVECTAGCGYGQVHDGGTEQPIVLCLLCDHRSCFYHKVAWHENMSCDEYDQLLADPVNFKSRFDRENEEAEEEVRRRRAQEDADRAFAQSLLEEEEAEAERGRREAQERERRRREELERREREKREQEARDARLLAAKRKQEEEASVLTMGRTTKPCPGCKSPIEKNKGCAHMTCLFCSNEYCWDCGADYHLILKRDNSVHKASCPWHPNNLPD